MQNIGVMSAFASSVFAFIFVISLQTYQIEPRILTANTTDICYGQQGQVCNCSDIVCLNDIEDTSTVHDESIVENNESTTPTTDDTTDNTTTIEPDYLLIRHCPFPQKANRTIIDFTNGGTRPLSDLAIQANSSLQESRITKNSSIVTPGEYRVHLASYHHPFLTSSYDTYGERWYIELFDANNSSILKTKSTRGTERDEIYIEETVESHAVIAQRTSTAVAKHMSYPNINPFTFAPLCAAFDFIEPLPDDTSFQTNEVDAIADDGTQEDEDVASKIEVPLEVLESDSSVTHTFMGCPITPSNARIIIDFTKNRQVSLQELTISSNKNSDDSKTNIYTTSIPKGVYRVRMSAYGGTFNTVDQKQQEWYVKLLSSSNSVVGESPTMEDIPAWIQGEYTRKVSDEFIIEQDVAKIVGLHAHYKDNSPNTLAPLCVAFDLVRPIIDTANEIVKPTRDIFAPTSHQTNTSIETKTTVSLPTDTSRDVKEEPVNIQATSDEIGIFGDREGIQMKQEIVEKRKKIIQELKNTPFTIIQNASQQMREELIQRVFENDDVTFDTSTTSSPHRLVQLKRKSAEEDSQEVFVDLKEDNEVPLEVFRFKERAELSDTKDSDGDGVTDYDEIYIYKTNPHNPFTGAGVLSDGERILLGLNPLSDDAVTTVLESPKIAGEVTNNLFTIEEIELTQKNIGDLAVVPSEKIRLKGIAEPLAFLTLYIYSTPIIVTVRTDEEGKFEYIMDEQLENGEHEVYIASVNSTGKILARSEPIPFVKTAEAIEYTPLVATSKANPVNDAMQTIASLSLLMTLLLMIGGTVWLGFLRAHHKEEITETIEHEREE